MINSPVQIKSCLCLPFLPFTQLAVTGGEQTAKNFVEKLSKYPANHYFPFLDCCVCVRKDYQPFLTRLLPVYCSLALWPGRDGERSWDEELLKGRIWSTSSENELTRGFLMIFLKETEKNTLHTLLLHNWKGSGKWQLLFTSRRILSTPRVCLWSAVQMQAVSKYSRNLRFVTFFSHQIEDSELYTIPAAFNPTGSFLVSRIDIRVRFMK